MKYYEQAAEVLTKVFKASRLDEEVSPQMVKMLMDEQQKEKKRSFEIMKRIKEFLDDAGYETDRTKIIGETGKKDVILSGRIKTMDSAMYNLLAMKNGEPQDLNDMIGLMIVCEDKATCYEIYNLMLKKCKENNCDVTHQKDMIVHPKKNGYQAIHMHIIDKMGYVFEIQIKTYKMFVFSQTGDCKHKRYKADFNTSVLTQEERVIFDSLRTECWL